MGPDPMGGTVVGGPPGGTKGAPGSSSGGPEMGNAGTTSLTAESGETGVPSGEADANGGAAGGIPAGRRSRTLGMAYWRGALAGFVDKSAPAGRAPGERSSNKARRSLPVLIPAWDTA